MSPEHPRSASGIQAPSPIGTPANTFPFWRPTRPSAVPDVGPGTTPAPGPPSHYKSGPPLLHAANRTRWFPPPAWWAVRRIILGERKMSRASGCNCSGFFPAGTGTNRKIFSRVPVAAKNFPGTTQSKQNFPGRILPGKFPGKITRETLARKSATCRFPIRSRRDRPSFIQGRDSGDCKSPAVVLRRRNPMTKIRKNSAVETMPTPEEIPH